MTTGVDNVSRLSYMGSHLALILGDRPYLHFLVQIRNLSIRGLGDGNGMKLNST